MANKALTIARKTTSAVKRKFEDERVQAGLGSVGGGVGAAIIDKDGIRRVGETPLNVNFLLGLGLQGVAVFWKKMPLRGAFAGVGAGMAGAGSYIMTHELRGTTELALSPPSA